MNRGAPGTRWQILGQQVMFAPQTPPGKPTTNADSWDGYRASRDRVFDMVEASEDRQLRRPHRRRAQQLGVRPAAAAVRDYDRATGRGSLGIEFAGTSVTSVSNLGAGPDGEKQLAAVQAARPHLHYVDGRYRGYYVVDLTRERLQADFFAMKTILDRTRRGAVREGLRGAGRPDALVGDSPTRRAADTNQRLPDPAPYAHRSDFRLQAEGTSA